MKQHLDEEMKKLNDTIYQVNQLVNITLLTSHVMLGLFIGKEFDKVGRYLKIDVKSLVNCTIKYLLN